jgi:hypothetical protein
VSIKFSVKREELPARYREILEQNPLLARLAGEVRGIGWTDNEILTVQLLAACSSNASLTERVRLLEGALAKP